MAVESGKAKERSGHLPRIMVIDDDGPLAGLLSEVLGEYCFNVVVVEDGGKALGVIRHEVFDLT